jgi:hypothetical protein
MLRIPISNVIFRFSSILADEVKFLRTAFR